MPDFDFSTLLPPEKRPKAEVKVPTKTITVVKPQKIVKIKKVVPKTMILQIPLIQTPPLAIEIDNSDFLRAFYKIIFGKSSRKESKLELATIFFQAFGQVKEELASG
ncbi:MAG: hypothetical protein ACXADY_20805 [Candidatus Hodarchaeales archaeon]|jgi:hypothetical protein